MSQVSRRPTSTLFPSVQEVCKMLSPEDPISAPTGCTIPTLQAEPQASDSSKASEL
ncbi:hypothetical protein PISMIDRAFT_19990 [Pisolithus microcarpus 441]|uniref:Uncharacterized protein n=1 Tax=Pisolithus microcarpus 441 TaxID=765257 RepID=A0A0C9XF31_9AGAM|nr:hypothetical protein BKA83DRAFT_19990 [Pisolithus microcarpus]KIK10890.1 hypothetical protein PISMIDRAFT_19990 [Pisolithus microcarpus 441]